MEIKEAHMKKILALIAILVVVGAGAWLLLKGKSSDSTSPTIPTTQSTTQNESAPPAQQPETNNTSTPNQTSAKKITYTASGFQPASLTVNSGDTIEITNSSNGVLQFQSDPHPQHTDNPELNVGVVSAGQTKTFTVTTKGQWGYHNHLNSAQHGEINVQ
jgi:plastocyanin